MNADPQGQLGLTDTWRRPLRSRGLPAILLSLGLVLFYVDLYWFDHLEPLARALGLRNKWFLYGALYSLAMLGGGVLYLRRRGNDRYHRARIAVNLAVQLVLAFLVPFVLPILGGPEPWLSYLWPLKVELFFPDSLRAMPGYLLLWFLGASLLLSPLLGLLVGKRWYCSWICGCGGLANTFGDPWRHLADRSARAWRVERISVYAVLVLAVLLTLLVGLQGPLTALHSSLGPAIDLLRRGYGFFIGAVLAGVVGTGLYPLLGPRIWCRFACPMAALLGLLQTRGRFWIRVKPRMCISCGNCSAYCEMGIDVRAYAQEDRSFRRASCVGCGMCAHVCPRGVLRLENGAWALPAEA